MAYYVRGDVVDLFDGFDGNPTPLAKTEVETLQAAQEECQRIKADLHTRGFRLDHACIVGPQGEVYSVTASRKGRSK